MILISDISKQEETSHLISMSSGERQVNMRHSIKVQVFFSKSKMLYNYKHVHSSIYRLSLLLCYTICENECLPNFTKMVTINMSLR